MDQLISFQINIMDYQNRRRNYSAPTQSQSFDYFVVLDFEATCEENKTLYPQEIIEFPSVLVNARTRQIEDRFQVYLRPVAHPKLTDFCKKLTGIQQDWVDNGVHITDAIEKHKEWLIQHGLISLSNDESAKFSFAFVTCGDWDLNVCLPNQAQAQNFRVPSYFNQWVNLKKIYGSAMKEHAGGMVQMLKGLGLNLEGRHHSGIDDCLNIARVLIKLLEKNVSIQVTGRR